MFLRCPREGRAPSLSLGGVLNGRLLGRLGRENQLFKGTKVAGFEVKREVL